MLENKADGIQIEMRQKYILYYHVLSQAAVEMLVFIPLAAFVRETSAVAY